MYGDKCVDVSTVRCLSKKKWGKHACVMRPMTATDESHHECVEEMIRATGHIQQKDTALKLGISKERVGHIINLPGFQKVCARWIPEN